MLERIAAEHNHRQVNHHIQVCRPDNTARPGKAIHIVEPAKDGKAEERWIYDPQKRQLKVKRARHAASAADRHRAGRLDPRHRRQRDNVRPQSQVQQQLYEDQWYQQQQQQHQQRRRRPWPADPYQLADAVNAAHGANGEPPAHMVQDWDRRYHSRTSRPSPARTNIDIEWEVIQSISNPDGAFNGGIDLVQHKKSKEMCIRKRLCAKRRCPGNDYLSWRREMLVMRKMSHPNIPYYVDSCYNPGKGSLYMQPCRFENLSQWCDHGMARLSPTMKEFFLWYVLQQVGQAILYMQTGFKTLAEADRADTSRVSGWVSLVHADIRTDQIFIDQAREDVNHGDTPRVLLGDFGFSQFIHPWRQTERHDGIGAGCRSKAPEFPAQISLKTDVYALGATAQMYLFPDANIKRGVSRGYFVKYGISVTLDDLICDCVEISPADRPGIRNVLRRVELRLKQYDDQGWSSSMIKPSWFKPIY